jgi:hypothetical protein
MLDLANRSLWPAPSGAVDWQVIKSPFDWNLHGIIQCDRPDLMIFAYLLYVFKSIHRMSLKSGDASQGPERKVEPVVNLSSMIVSIFYQCKFMKRVSNDQMQSYAKCKCHDRSHEYKLAYFISHFHWHQTLRVLFPEAECHDERHAFKE